MYLLYSLKAILSYFRPCSVLAEVNVFVDMKICESFS
jgi:hypothetical protein